MERFSPVADTTEFAHGITPHKQSATVVTTSFASLGLLLVFSDTEKAGSLREHWEFQQPMAVIQLSRGCRFPSPVVAEQSLEVLTTSIETADRLAIAKSATANGELYRMKFSRQSLILSRKVGNTKRLPSR